MSHRHRNGSAEVTPEEWRSFREDASKHRRALERIVRRTLVHDPRVAEARLRNLDPVDFADEAMCWALSEWRAKPSGVTPEQWARKRALQILDAALDRESLNAEGRAEERRVESQLRAGEIEPQDEVESLWREVFEEETREIPPDFEELPSDPAVSQADVRFSEAERVTELTQALRRLPDLQRRVVSLRFLDGLKADDVAYLLDLTPEQASQEMAEALRALRTELAAV
jgi:RNA polymerase sigma factor (sigma-70 family)